MNLNNDMIIMNNNNSSSSSCNSVGYNVSCYTSSSNSSIENNISENVNKTTVIHNFLLNERNKLTNSQNRNNFSLNGNIINGFIVSQNNKTLPAQANLNFENMIGNNNLQGFPFPPNQEQQQQFSGQNENQQNFNMLKLMDASISQKMPIGSTQQPKPLSVNNYNFSSNENSKNGFELQNIPQVRSYRRKFKCAHENKVDCTPECDQGAGLKSDKKNEYARLQMRKYREKIKSDPIRYMKYLQTERERNAKRKFRKMQKLIKEQGITDPETIIKMEKRESNRLYRLRCKLSPHRRIRTSTQEKLFKALIEKFENGEYKLSDDFMGKTFKSNEHVREFMIQQLQNLQNEKMSKDASLSDTENLIEQDDGITDTEENSRDSSIQNCTDDDSNMDDDFELPAFNRICAVINCPSRYKGDDVEYFPLPTQKKIRDLWIRQIKLHCQQWEVNPNGFICSLHFPSVWFDSNKFSEKEFLSKAVPLIFPNGSAKQFDVDIPEMEEKDFESINCTKNFHKWSVDKIREQENLLKHQHSILENQGEMNFLQKIKITKIMNQINEFKSKYLFADDVKTDLDNIFDKIKGISMNFPN